MKTITLTNSKGIVLVDEEDYEKLWRYNWRLHPKGYATRKDMSIDREVLMHRQIMNTEAGQEIDHRDRNKLNNQKTNLRFASPSINAQNQGVRKNNTSGYVGVSYDKRLDRWRACIRHEGKQKELGRFICCHKAAIAYNKAALELFGPDAYTNEIFVG